MSEEKERYDLLLCYENRMTKVIPNMVASLVRYLNGNGIIQQGEEAISEEWTELYFKPGASSHLPFVPRGYDGPQPVFYELVICFGNKGSPMPYGDEGIIYFYIEFRGCLFSEIHGSFRKKLNEFTQLRIATFSRKHIGLPPHKETTIQKVSQSEVKDSGSKGGAVGTRVEEW